MIPASKLKASTSIKRVRRTEDAQVTIAALREVSRPGHASRGVLVSGGVRLDKVSPGGGQDASEVQRFLVTGGCGYLGRELVRRGGAYEVLSAR